MSSFRNDTTRKIEVKLPRHRVKVTAKNPFVVITDVSTNSSAVSQLPQPAVMHDGAHFVPAIPFLQLLGRLASTVVAFDDRTSAIDFGTTSPRPRHDVTGLEIEPRLNGYLLTVRAARRLNDVEKWLKKPDGWLFITIPDATADEQALKNVKPYGPVRQVLVFQSPTSVQLTIRVAPDVVEADLLQDPDSDNLLISLHTASVTEKEEPERKRQELIRNNLEGARARWKLDVIVIDAGHGGKDPGTIGVAGTREKDVTLAVALRLGELIQKNMKDVRVVYTRKTDTFVELYRRTQIANEAGGKLFISLHCNSTERKPSSANGFEIYLLRPGKTEHALRIAERENAVIKLEEGYEERYKKLTEEEFILLSMAQSAFMKHSERFAEIASEAMARHLNIKNSGVKQAGFYVLVGASMPNVLVEMGYLSNRNEERMLASKQGQQRIAEALFQGIKEYKTIYEQSLQEGRTASNPM